MKSLLCFIGFLLLVVPTRAQTNIPLQKVSGTNVLTSTTNPVVVGSGQTLTVANGGTLNVAGTLNITGSSNVLTSAGSYANPSWLTTLDWSKLINKPSIGTVSSVGLTMPPIFSVGSSPVTSSGTLAVTFATGQTANQVLASPNGSSGAVSLRPLVPADIPALTLAKISDAGTAASHDTAYFQTPQTSAAGYGIANGTSIDQWGTKTRPSTDIFASGPANYVLATPDGASGVPVKRALTAADIPPLTLSQFPQITGHTLIGNANTDAGIPQAMSPETAKGVLNIGAADVAGLGNAALLDVGVTSGTVAAGNDPRFNVPLYTALGQIAYAGVAAKPAILNGNTSATKKFLAQTGDGANSAAPQWVTVTPTDLPAPTPTTLGGVNSHAAVTHQFLTQIGTDGSVAGAQPSAADLSNGVSGTGAVVLATGNAATATALATPRAINGVNFDGTSAITVTAAAGTLSGTTLAAGVTVVQTFDVQRYGAIPNDGNDDTTAIQNAVTAASAVNGTVYFSPGVYQVTGLTLNNFNGSFVGSGISATTIRCTSTAAPVISITGTMNGATISDFLLEYPGASDGSARPSVSTAVGIYVSGAVLNSGFSRIKIRNTYDGFLQTSDSSLWNCLFSQIQVSQFYDIGVYRRGGTQSLWNRLIVENSDGSGGALSCTSAVIDDTGSGDTFSNLNIESVNCGIPLKFDDGTNVTIDGLHTENWLASVDGASLIYTAAYGLTINGWSLTNCKFDNNCSLIRPVSTGSTLLRSVVVNDAVFRAGSSGRTGGGVTVKRVEPISAPLHSIVVNGYTEVTDGGTPINLSDTFYGWNCLNPNSTLVNRVVYNEDWVDYAPGSSITNSSFGGLFYWRFNLVGGGTITHTGSGGQDAGTLDFKSGTVVATDGCIAYTQNAWGLTSAVTKVTFKEKLSAVPTASDSAVVRVGFYNNTGGTYSSISTPTRGFGIKFDPSVNASNWLLEVIDTSGTTTNVDTGVAATTNRVIWNVLVLNGRIFAWATASAVSPVNVTSGNLPVNISDGVYPSISVYKSDGTGHGTTQYVLTSDFFRAYRHAGNNEL